MSEVDGSAPESVGGCGCDLESLRSLTGLGISAEAVHLYGYLLRTRQATPAALSEHAGLTGERTTQVVAELSRSALVSLHDDLVRAVRPSVALPRLLEQFDQQLQAQRSRLSAARAATTTVVQDSIEQHRRHVGLEVATGAEQAGARVSDLLAGASHEVLTMVTTLPEDSTLAHARTADLWLLERGVGTRMLVLAAHLRRSAAYREHLGLLAQKGARIRVAAGLPTRMLLIDGATAVLPDVDDAPEQGAIVVRHASLVRLATQVFEAMWDGTPTLEAYPRDGGGDDAAAWAPSDLERQVIRLLAQGNKDEAVARRVGMSLRSLRRLIAQVSHEAGASSRFELGVQCRDRGWL